MTSAGGVLLPSGVLVHRRYEVLREVGRGGFSVVYAARDRETDTVVALKVLSPPPSAARSAGERLRRELEISRTLSGPGVVPVHALLEEDGHAILVMEYVPGPDLSTRLRERGSLPVQEVVVLGRRLAQTLAQAHERGIVHRDIKPENVLLPRMEGARLTDFGAARLEGQSAVTRTGDLAGTLLYAAPELLAGDRGDARSDIYSLGLTLFVALVGHLPERPSPHLPPPAEPGGHHPRRSRGGGHVPAWLDDVVARATAALPRDRFQTMDALGEALKAEEEGTEIAFTPTAEEPATQSTCLLCDQPSPLGLPVCGACGGMDPGAADHLLFLRRPPWTERPAARQALEELLPGAGADDAIREAVLGRRAVARVPDPAGGGVLDTLHSHRLDGYLVPSRAVWRAVPSSFVLLLLAIVGAGIVVGLTTAPAFLWASPLIAGLLLMGAIRSIRTPVLQVAPSASPLPSAVDTQATHTLLHLRPGGARRLLADILRLARELGANQSPGFELPERVAPLVSSSCTAAAELATLDEHLERFDAQRRDLQQLPQEWWDSLTEVETSRERLAHQLLQVVSALGRARRLGADAVNGATAELAALLADERATSERGASYSPGDAGYPLPA